MTITLRELRQQRGLTLDALACLADDQMNIGHISRIERGLVRPRPETIVRLARALGISVRRLQKIIEATIDAAA